MVTRRTIIITVLLVPTARLQWGRAVRFKHWTINTLSSVIDTLLISIHINTVLSPVGWNEWIKYCNGDGDNRVGRMMNGGDRQRGNKPRNAAGGKRRGTTGGLRVCDTCTCSIRAHRRRPPRSNLDEHFPRRLLIVSVNNLSPAVQVSSVLFLLYDVYKLSRTTADSAPIRSVPSDTSAGRVFVRQRGRVRDASETVNWTHKSYKRDEFETDEVVFSVLQKSLSNCRFHVVNAVVRRTCSESRLSFDLAFWWVG